MAQPLYSVLPLGVGLVLIYTLGTVIYRLWFDPLRKYPGPTLARFSRIPYVYHTVKGDMVTWGHQLHNQYGDVVRVAPDELSYNNDAWKDIYGHAKQGQKTTQKDLRFYGPAIAENGTDIIRANESDHARFRRNFSNAFSDRALREQESLIQTYVDQLIAKLHGLADAAQHDGTSRNIDIVKMYNFTTFDIMSDLTFGEPLGLLGGSEYNEWVAVIFASLKFVAVSRVMRYFPLLSKLANWVIMSMTSLKEKRMTNLMYCARRVDKRIAKKEARPDIWGLLLAQQNEDRKLTLPEMYCNSQIFMVAGTETTATLLSGLTYLLLTNPAKMEKLTKEIRDRFQAEEDIAIVTLARLEYLQACLEEGLRMYPPVPVGTPRMVPPEGKMVCGDMIPGKTALSILHWSTYRNPKHFKYPDSFIPERWTGDPEFDNDNKTCLQPFSFGPRNCLGKNLAYHEMRVILAKVLWHFDLSLCEESLNWLDQKSYNVWEKPPLFVRLTPRKVQQ